jgi:hypothetical protein
VQVHLRNVPYRSLQETNSTVQEAYRTVQEAYRTVQEVYSTVQKAYRTVQKAYHTLQSVQDNLYANPSLKSVPHHADYHMTFIFRPSHNFILIMNDVTHVEGEHRLLVSVIMRSIILKYKNTWFDEILRTKYSYFLGIEPVRHFVVSTYFMGYAESIIKICIDKTCAIKCPKTA